MKKTINSESSDRIVTIFMIGGRNRVIVIKRSGPQLIGRLIAYKMLGRKIPAPMEVFDQHSGQSERTHN